jgi:signal transduction histidine kinase/streptogramin lyase
MIKPFTNLLFLVLVASLGFAQQEKIAFEKYGVPEGLPEEYVSHLVQDDKGFVWFTTQNGLVKYDGYTFKVYKIATDPKDTTDFGLKSCVGGLLKAKDGKLWIAGWSDKGRISCFDPVTEKFRNYLPDKEGTNKLKSAVCYLVFEDKQENIWYRSYTAFGDRALFRLNPKTGIIQQYSIKENGYTSRAIGTTFSKIAESTTGIWLLDEKNNLNQRTLQKDRFDVIISAGTFFSRTKDTMRLLIKRRDHSLLLTGDHGVYIFDPNKKQLLKRYVHQAGVAKGLADSTLNAIEDEKGHIWVIHKGGVISLIDPIVNHISTFTYGRDSFTFPNGPKQLTNVLVSAMNKAGVWFQSKNGNLNYFFRYSFSTKTFRFYDGNFNLPANSLSQNRTIYGFSEDKTGLLWLFTRPNLYKQAPKKQQMGLYRHRPGEPTGLPSDTISYLLEDSKKRLWVGTSAGLAIYQPGQDNFRVFQNDPSKAGSLSDNRIINIQEDSNGTIWVATMNGLNRWQESTQSFRRFFYHPKETNICILNIDRQQRLWLSVWNKGVFVLDRKTGQIVKSFIPDAKNPASLSSKQIYNFFQDSRGTIWLGDLNDNQFGLYRLNAKEDGFIHYLPISGDSTSISSNEIHFITEDGKKRLWIGTDGGLNLYDPVKNRFTRFSSPEAISYSCYAKDLKGNLRFGTYSGGGLVSVDAASGKITAYGEKSGLLHNDSGLGGLNARIALDELGRLWLPTQRGLSVFDPVNKSFTNYFEKDGFQPAARSYVEIKTNNGDIWIGGYNGLNHIVPAQLLRKDTTLPSVVITRMTINDSLYSKPDGVILKKSVAYTDAIQLEYWQKNVSFDFVALHYLRSEDNQYSWKLENYDQNWSAPSKERKVSYTNLSPGTYIFRVKASNADGVWNEKGTSITITILPPWWRTWWAYAFYALALAGALRAYIVFRSRTLRRENRILEEKVELRTTQLQSSLENLKFTQTQLIQKEKLASLGELTAGIAHEIQNPLNFVNNFSELSVELAHELKEEVQKPEIDKETVAALVEDLAENQEKINLHGKRASSIVKGMLEHSRTGTGERQLTDINQLADEYLRLSYHGLRAKDSSFNSDYELITDENLPKINVVSQEIGRVLLNLINNAFYAVNERSKVKEAGYQPKVTVTTKAAENQSDRRAVEVHVHDNGMGMSDATKAKIFQPFFTTKPTGEGTGLGLSLAYDIVTKGHGGTIEVKSAKGEGTTFVVKLPISNS